METDFDLRKNMIRDFSLCLKGQYRRFFHDVCVYFITRETHQFLPEVKRSKIGQVFGNQSRRFPVFSKLSQTTEANSDNTSLQLLTSDIIIGNQKNVGIVVNRKCIDDILLTIGMRLFNTSCENCCIVFIATKHIIFVRNCCDVRGQVRLFKRRRQQRKIDFQTESKEGLIFLEILDHFSSGKK